MNEVLGGVMKSKYLTQLISVAIVVALAAGLLPVSARNVRRYPMLPTFTMQDLGALGAISEGQFVNDNGDVTGFNK